MEHSNKVISCCSTLYKIWDDVILMLIANHLPHRRHGVVEMRLWEQVQELKSVYVSSHFAGISGQWTLHL